MSAVLPLIAQFGSDNGHMGGDWGWLAVGAMVVMMGGMGYMMWSMMRRPKDQGGDGGTRGSDRATEEALRRRRAEHGGVSREPQGDRGDATMTVPGVAPTSRADVPRWIPTMFRAAGVTNWLIAEPAMVAPRWSAEMLGSPAPHPLHVPGDRRRSARQARADPIRLGREARLGDRDHHRLPGGRRAPLGARADYDRRLGDDPAVRLCQAQARRHRRGAAEGGYRRRCRVRLLRPSPLRRVVIPFCSP